MKGLGVVLPTEWVGTDSFSINVFEGMIEGAMESDWHKPDKKKQHISTLVNCPKQTALNQLFKPKFNAKTRGIFWIGEKFFHYTVEAKYLETFPDGVAEFPIKKLVLKNKKDKFWIVGKIDLMDFQNSRLIDIKSSNDRAMGYIRKGLKKRNGEIIPKGAKESHIAQALIYYHMWNTYFAHNDPSDPYYLKECGILYIDKDNFQDLYCPINLRIYDPEKTFNNALQNAIDIHRAVNFDEWDQIKIKWIKDPSYWLCKGYCDQRERCNEY